MNPNEFDIVAVVRSAFMAGFCRHSTWEDYYDENPLPEEFPPRARELVSENLRTAFLFGSTRNFIWREDEGIAHPFSKRIQDEE